jgi:hypothetical protein
MWTGFGIVGLERGGGGIVDAVTILRETKKAVICLINTCYVYLLIIEQLFFLPTHRTSGML